MSQPQWKVDATNVWNHLQSTDHHVGYSRYTGNDQLAIITPLQDVRALQTHPDYKTIRQPSMAGQQP